MPAQIPFSSRHKPIIEVDGLQFRDLDGDGQLTPFEDWRLSPRERAADLVHRISPRGEDRPDGHHLAPHGDLPAEQRTHQRRCRHPGNIPGRNGGPRVCARDTCAWRTCSPIHDGIEPLANALLFGFETDYPVMVDAMFGGFSPTGRLPITFPIDAAAIAVDEDGNCASPNDVPGFEKEKYMDGRPYVYVDGDGNRDQLGHGLSYA